MLLDEESPGIQSKCAENNEVDVCWIYRVRKGQIRIWVRAGSRVDILVEIKKYGFVNWVWLGKQRFSKLFEETGCWGKENLSLSFNPTAFLGWLSFCVRWWLINELMARFLSISLLLLDFVLNLCHELLGFLFWVMLKLVSVGLFSYCCMASRWKTQPCDC